MGTDANAVYKLLTPPSVCHRGDQANFSGQLKGIMSLFSILRSVTHNVQGLKRLEVTGDLVARIDTIRHVT
jgi:hypothetical protein